MPALLTWIWKALQQNGYSSAPLRDTYLDNHDMGGFLPLYDFREIMNNFDTRFMMDLPYDGGSSITEDNHVALEIAQQFDLRPDWTFSRPKYKIDSTIGSRTLRTSEFCALLIRLRQMGFAGDPSPWVDALRPEIRKMSFLTQSELDVYWFRDRLKKFPPLTLGGDESHRPWDDELEVSSGANPFIQMWLGPDNEVTSLSFMSQSEKKRRFL